MVISLVSPRNGLTGEVKWGFTHIALSRVGVLTGYGDIHSEGVPLLALRIFPGMLSNSARSNMPAKPIWPAAAKTLGGTGIRPTRCLFYLSASSSDRTEFNQVPYSVSPHWTGHYPEHQGLCFPQNPRQRQIHQTSPGNLPVPPGHIAIHRLTQSRNRQVQAA